MRRCIRQPHRHTEAAWNARAGATCWTQTGYDSNSNSNIAYGTNGPLVVDAFIDDTGGGLSHADSLHSVAKLACGKNGVTQIRTRGHVVIVGTDVHELCIIHNSYDLMLRSKQRGGWAPALVSLPAALQCWHGRHGRWRRQRAAWKQLHGCLYVQALLCVHALLYVHAFPLH